LKFLGKDNAVRALISTHLPKFVFLLALVPGVAMTFAMHTTTERRLMAEFEGAAALAVDRVVTRLQQHVVVLRAARGLTSATHGVVVRDEFVRFLSSFDIANELPGIQGIGFARMLAVSDAEAAISEVRKNYGFQVAIRPETKQSWRTPIVLLEPANERNIAALGFDMYADRTRRLAMDHAIASGDAQMSGPVELVQEITEEKQTGFLVYLPFQADVRPTGTRAAPVSGFVYAPFRGGDLIQAALSVGPALPVSLRIVDTGDAEAPLFDNTTSESDRTMRHIRTVEMLGRQWMFEILGNQPDIVWARYLNSVLIGLTSLLFAAAVAHAVKARQDEATQARAVAAAAEREANYRELLLQEMKHRIKNHIARIQSIARQSARGATDVKAFTSAFDARLQAMSAAQEILAGTAVAQADITTVLQKELQQSLGAAEVDHLIKGPPVRLDERQAHAFALVVHELVTNAMKYGGLSATGSGLSVAWTVRPATLTTPPYLEMDWVERFDGAEPSLSNGSGFGSRLIEASLKGELSGTINRDFRPDGLIIRILLPLHAALNGHRSA
jgi:CHASE1-domain containing sensor protein/two-component sensor histidine kinase